MLRHCACACRKVNLRSSENEPKGVAMQKVLGVGLCWLATASGFRDIILGELQVNVLFDAVHQSLQTPAVVLHHPRHGYTRCVDWHRLVVPQLIYCEGSGSSAVVATKSELLDGAVALKLSGLAQNWVRGQCLPRQAQFFLRAVREEWVSSNMLQHVVVEHPSPDCHRAFAAGCE